MSHVNTPGKVEEAIELLVERLLGYLAQERGADIRRFKPGQGIDLS